MPAVFNSAKLLSRNSPWFCSIGFFFVVIDRNKLMYCPGHLAWIFLFAANVLLFAKGTQWGEMKIGNNTANNRSASVCVAVYNSSGVDHSYCVLKQGFLLHELIFSLCYWGSCLFVRQRVSTGCRNLICTMHIQTPGFFLAPDQTRMVDWWSGKGRALELAGCLFLFLIWWWWGHISTLCLNKREDDKSC